MSEHNEDAKTTVLPIVADAIRARASAIPKHAKPGDEFIIKLVGDDWLDGRMSEIGLKPGAQVKGVLTDSPEGDEFHVVGYELPLKEGDPVVAGQVYAYDSDTEHWRCEVVNRLKAGPYGDELNLEGVESDAVNHPAHYRSGGMEVIDVIEAFELDRKSGHAQNVVKYVLRAGEKGELLTDLKKAQWYMNRLVARIEQNGGAW